MSISSSSISSSSSWYGRTCINESKLYYSCHNSSVRLDKLGREINNSLCKDSDSDSSDTSDSSKKSSVRRKYTPEEIAKRIFDLYPWNDNPEQLDGQEAIRRYKQLNSRPGFPSREFTEREARIGLIRSFHQRYLEEMGRRQIELDAKNNDGSCNLI